MTKNESQELNKTMRVLRKLDGSGTAGNCVGTARRLDLSGADLDIALQIVGGNSDNPVAQSATAAAKEFYVRIAGALEFTQK